MEISTVRISEPVYRAVACTLCGVAIIGAGARTVLRVQKNQQQIRDDLLFLFACICLVAATILLMKEAASVYLLANAIARIVDGTASGNQVGPIPPSFLSAIAVAQSEGYAYAVLMWVVIYTVKICYLLFFRLLIDRVKGMITYWRITMGITMISSAFSICALFIACPYFGFRSLECFSASFATRLLSMEVTPMCLDIVTDLMIIAIPIQLISSVKIRTRQKFGIGFFLCLSFFMIAIEVIRVSNVRAADFQVWANFWIQIEGCVAIMTVSLTAFRTFFVSEHSSAGKRKPSPTYSSRRRLWFRRNQAAEGHDEAKVSIIIPGPTMTGMRTFIRGSRHGTMPATEHREETHDSTIQVSHKMSTDSESASRFERTSTEDC